MVARSRGRAGALSSGAVPGASRTHRDTLAFVLTILGATLWSMWPASMVMAERRLGPEVGIPLLFGAGACVGAWTGVTVWRHVATWLPPLVAGVVASAVVMIQRQSVDGTTDLDLFRIAGVVCAVAGSAVGVALGRRARVPRRALAAVWITLGGPALLLLGIAGAAALGADVDSGWLKLIVFFSPVPAAAAATWLCGAVRPRDFTLGLWGLLSVGVLMGRPEGDALVAFVLVPIFCGFIALVASVPVRLVHDRRPAREDLPSAQVIER